MNNEMVFVVEPDVGRVTVEISQASHQAVYDVADDLGTRVNLNCAKPAENSRRNLPVLPRQCSSTRQTESDEFSIWLYRLYHHSTVDGPGRRSVVQVSGCSIRCPGCFVSQTHKRENGTLISISTIVDEIVANRAEHDGVTILGGEPFDQPSQVAELVSRLKLRGFHITVYSGYTMEVLMQRKTPSIDYILTHIDLLIDGPFVASVSDRASEYRGSRNQRLIFDPGRLSKY
jgi:anaerobic ribonucleoside-triphosphate reductase activating protein